MDKDYFEGVFREVGKIGVVGGWGKNIAKSYQTVTDIPTVNRLHLSNILRKLYRNKAKGMAGKIVEWFDRIDSFHIRRGKPLPQHLKNDLFFSMGFMHSEQVMWNWQQNFANDSDQVLEEQDASWYRKIKKLLEDIPDHDSFDRQIIVLKINRIIYEEFALRGGTGIAIAERQLQSLSNFKSRRGQKVPNINHDIQVHLRDDLANNLKNRREKKDGTSSNNKKATELLLELTSFFGVVTIAKNRLRTEQVKYRI